MIELKVGYGFAVVVKKIMVARSVIKVYRTTLGGSMQLFSLARLSHLHRLR